MSYKNLHIHGTLQDKLDQFKSVDGPLSGQMFAEERVKMSSIFAFSSWRIAYGHDAMEVQHL